MSDGAIDLREARDRAYSMPLEEISPADPALFAADAMWPYFERLRKEDPVHYCTTDEETGPYWSVTRFNDIMEIETIKKVIAENKILKGTMGAASYSALIEGKVAELGEGVGHDRDRAVLHRHAQAAAAQHVVDAAQVSASAAFGLSIETAPSASTICPPP